MNDNNIKGECAKGERIRFRTGRKHPKKYTIFTVKKEDSIFFGVSKWNNKEDEYNRREGIEVAKKRAYNAAEFDNFVNNLGPFVSKDGLSGKFKYKNYRKMLSYFNKFR